MSLTLKRILFTLTINVSLFTILMIGIQNSNRSSKISFINKETVELPVSFVTGISFIIGSMIGGLLPINYFFKKK